MAVQRLYYRSFAGGKVSRELWGRIDDGNYQTGLADCVNFMVRPTGAAENRPGTQFVAFAKYHDRPCRLIPFTFSTDQSMVLELGHQYVRFHTMGQTLMLGGQPYEVAAPWTGDMVKDIHHVQSADVVTLVHPSMPPQELRRLGPAHWELAPIDFTPPNAGFSASAAATTAAGMPPSMSYAYAVTRIRDADGAESLPVELPAVTNNLFITGNKNTITVTDFAAGTREYLVYKLQGGSFGYIGRIAGASKPSVVDDNIAPDMGRTPPRYDPTLADNWPSAVSYFEQRRVFAGPAKAPQNVWMTRSGTESEVTYSVPVRDDDRIALRVAAREVNAIRHVVPLSSLLLLTSSAEWRLTSVNSDAVTPTSVAVKPQSYVGASNVQPLVVGSSALFGAARGGHLHEIGYNWQAQGFVVGDLSIRNADDFDLKAVVDLAYCKAPYPVVWAVSSNGKLLGMTYVPEQQVGGWHTHETLNGEFESICSAAEYDFYDMPYVVVKRTLGGKVRRCIERLGWRVVGTAPIDPAYAFFMDCAVSRNEPGQTALCGLEHLEGEQVSILADGVVLKPQRVVCGQVKLPGPTTIATAGLPIKAFIRTLPVAVGNDPAFGQGRMKNVNKLWLRVHRSSAIQAGPSLGQLREYKQRTTEPYGAPPALVSEEIELPIDGAWEQGGGQVYVVQDQPLPLTVLGLTAEVVIGG